MTQVRAHSVLSGPVNQSSLVTARVDELPLGGVESVRPSGQEAVLIPSERESHENEDSGMSVD